MDVNYVNVHSSLEFFFFICFLFYHKDDVASWFIIKIAPCEAHDAK